MLAWVLLWGSWSAANLLSGVLVAVLAVVTLPLPSVTAGVRVRPLGLLSLVWHVVVDLVVSSVQIAWQALRPSGAGATAIIVVALRTDSDILQTSVAQALTLVPGSMAVEVDGDDRRLGVHVLVVSRRVDVAAERRAVLALEAAGIMWSLDEPVGVHSPDCGVYPVEGSGGAGRGQSWLAAAEPPYGRASSALRPTRATS